MKTALHVYQLFGFNEVPVDIDDYERYDYQAELLLNEYLLTLIKGLDFDSILLHKALDKNKKQQGN